MITLKKQPDKNIRNILHPIVKKWFFKKFEDFSEPQKFGVMDIHSRKNVLISSPTGSGKTLTAFLSILNELIDSAEKGILEDKIYAIYISPLRALSNDVEKNLNLPLAEMQEMAEKEFGIRIGVRTGDTTQYEKTKMSKNPPHIFITTPESLGIVLASQKFSNNFKDVQWLVIDEIHSLASDKRGVHLGLSMEKLQSLSSGLCRVGLSATVAPLESVAQYLVGSDRDCTIVDVQYMKDIDLQVVSPVKDLINTSTEKKMDAMYNLLDKMIQKHRTTLIFTNTRAGTERIVHYLKDKFPSNYVEIGEEGEDVKSLIGAHHGSLSREHRVNLENRLKLGELKAVVCSTSLELGIDIGYVDLVVLLGSPKSVARGLQRIGRSGHKLHEKANGKIIVLDRDDLVECSVLMKNAKEKKIDRIHIPENCLDVLAQQIYGFVVNESMIVEDLFLMVKKCYNFRNLTREDFDSVLKYLAGEYNLEHRHIYAKVWIENGKIGRRSSLSRMLYMTNIGTIPDQSGIMVKIGNAKIGKLDEGFLEKLKPGDIFVLGGNTYMFKHARGMVANVTAAPGRRPTVPQWVSENLPLSFDLAEDINNFRYLMNDKLENGVNKKDLIEFIHSYLYVDDNAANSIYKYFKMQYDYVVVPDKRKIVVEYYSEDDKKYMIFHSLYGRRVNDCLSRAFAFVLAKGKDVEVGISDNGFYFASDQFFNLSRLWDFIDLDNFEEVLKLALDKSQVLRRRFRHVAGRSLMILRNYKGRTKRVGKQQVSSMILLKAVKDIDDNFPMLKEARREVLEDLMDVQNAKEVLRRIIEKELRIVEVETKIPSPFAFNQVLKGFADIMTMSEKDEFLQRMHNMVLAKIGLKMGKMRG